ncbi:MAG TPA: alpha-hydroxy acid oxidase [Acidimicrobiales bacterium]|nr:alpha-hydroxy acid oxidase [Acidimicrobiales bacterium]
MSDHSNQSAPMVGLPGVVGLGDLEALAEAVLEPQAFAYYAGGAGDEVTLRDNVDAWSRHRLRPRVLVDVARIDPATTLLGQAVSMPVGIAPTALHGLASPEAEVATARAAARAGVVLCASSLATRPVEDLEPAGGLRWFQLYEHRDRAITLDLIARAEASGCTALVVTVDLPVFGQREREIRSGFTQPLATGYGNFASYAVAGDVETVTDGLHSSQLTWDDLEWLRRATSLPMVLKGILTGEDAAISCELGVDAVWVSNHGGRQLDHTPAGIDVLEEIVSAVAGRAEVYLDGGVRRGTDVLTALALGARAVFAGRPWLYALALGGEDGVVSALEILRTELVIAMALLGTPTVADVTRAHVR